jgi:hypothetical protein
MRQGRIVGELDGHDAAEHDVLKLAFGTQTLEGAI